MHEAAEALDDVLHGRSSGLHRRTMLMYARRADDLIVVASSGGRSAHLVMQESTARAFPVVVLTPER